jgi:UDP-MurNAc hydroxylase
MYSEPVVSEPARFQILSHAGLLVQGGGKSLIFDPWLVGSSYWRSWWNYPPVPRALIDSLRPDFIYLTHIHWDHFHGPSLRKFPRETPILIPKLPSLRMRKDLLEMGFPNVTEVPHGRTLELAAGLRITSYQFYPFNDSAAVVECGDKTLFNANDAKFMGAPLDQILSRHPRIDFVFRSHSPANERMCFDFMDAPMRLREEAGRHLRDFDDFARKVGARYAIPFASNHCYLHRETFHLNHTVITPVQVETFCRNRERSFPAEGTSRRVPEVKVMVAGDSWSSETGFNIGEAPWFTDRDRCLRQYADGQAEALAKFYLLEGRTDATLIQVEGYFRKFIEALPWIARRIFRGRPVTYVLTGKGRHCFWVDMERGVVREISGMEDADHPLQIHTSAYVFRRCMAQNLFIHLGISKRVLFRCKQADAKYIHILITLFNLYETGMLPVWKMLSPRFVLGWVPRWREVALYAAILARKAMGRPFVMADYLGAERPAPPPPPPVSQSSPGTVPTRIFRPKTAEIAVPGGSQL